MQLFEIRICGPPPRLPRPAIGVYRQTYRWAAAAGGEIWELGRVTPRPGQ
jgi:hypothetical protein